MQSVKHDCCTLVFYFSKLDCRNCFLITVSRFVFPRFVLEKGLVTYGNALWFTVLVEILNYFYTFCPPTSFFSLFLLSSAVVAFTCSGNAYSYSMASRRQQFWHSLKSSHSTYCSLCMCRWKSENVDCTHWDETSFALWDSLLSFI